MPLSWIVMVGICAGEGDEGGGCLPCAGAGAARAREEKMARAESVMSVDFMLLA